MSGADRDAARAEAAARRAEAAAEEAEAAVRELHGPPLPLEERDMPADGGDFTENLPPMPVPAVDVETNAGHPAGGPRD